MKTYRKEIWQLTEKTLENSDFLLVDIIVRGSAHNPVFEIFIDSAKGITTDDCAEISRKLHELFESSEIGKTKYRLDVSSPGADRPLKFIEQYPKHIGRRFEVEFLSEGKNVKMKAELKSVDGEKLTFAGKNEIVELDINQIKKAKVIIGF